MMTIPRAELNKVGHRHGIDWNLDADPTLEWVRAAAADLREETPDFPTTEELLCEADDLDALADRYERKTVA